MPNAVIESGKLETILQKAWNGERLSQEEGTALWDVDLLTLGRLADRRRKQLHPQNLGTFVIDLNTNYTNICVAKCKFCAFYRTPGTAETYLLTHEDIYKKLEALRAIGGTQILMQGGVTPEIPYSYYIDLIKGISSRFPEIYIHSFSPTEILCFSRWNKMSVKDVLLQFKEAGLKSLPGSIEMLVDRMHEEVASGKPKPEEWLSVMETAHSLGMPSTATMVIGMGETYAERTEHLIKIRNLQDKTGGFRAFITWTFSPYHTELSHLQTAGGMEYLKSLAVARLVLDNVKQLHSGWVTEGLKLAQIGLSFGANDLGGILMEENVVGATGVKFKSSVNKMLKLIRGAGMIPAQRDTEYNVLKVYEAE